MADLVTDEEAGKAFEAFLESLPGDLFNAPIPRGEWVGPGFDDETRDGKGADDDGEQPSEG